MHQQQLDRWQSLPESVKSAVAETFRESYDREPDPEQSICDLYRCLRLAGVGAEPAAPDPRDVLKFPSPAIDNMRRASGERDG